MGGGIDSHHSPERSFFRRSTALRRAGVFEEGMIKKYKNATGVLALEDYRARRGNILVISPHPDDDVLGAGGTMALAAEDRRAVFSVYITDGRGSPRREPGISDEEMASAREKEAIVSLKAVGAAGGFFLRRRSQELGGTGGGEVRNELEEILNFLRPAEIYLPAPYERHKTHQICSGITIDALRAKVDWPATAFGYSLWGSFWGEKRRVVRDISSVIRKKVDAVLSHSTQIKYKNYHQGILGKNNYEAVFWESHEIQKASFVEIFLDMTALIEEKDSSLESFAREDFESFIRRYLRPL
jgi:N-acetylglucosamine malate deacetylase 1